MEINLKESLALKSKQFEPLRFDQADEKIGKTFYQNNFYQIQMLIDFTH